MGPEAHDTSNHVPRGRSSDEEYLADGVQGLPPPLRHHWKERKAWTALGSCFPPRMDRPLFRRGHFLIRLGASLPFFIFGANSRAFPLGADPWRQDQLLQTTKGPPTVPRRPGRIYSTNKVASRDGKQTEGYKASHPCPSLSLTQTTPRPVRALLCFSRSSRVASSREKRQNRARHELIDRALPFLPFGFIFLSILVTLSVHISPLLSSWADAC